MTQSGSVVLGNDVKVGIGNSAPKEKLQVQGGNLYMSSTDTGVILKSPDGATCAKLTLSNAGVLVTTIITFP